MPPDNEDIFHAPTIADMPRRMLYAAQRRRRREPLVQPILEIGHCYYEAWQHGEAMILLQRYSLHEEATETARQQVTGIYAFQRILFSITIIGPRTEMSQAILLIEILALPIERI
jgi:hypothetical protein